MSRATRHQAPNPLDVRLASPHLTPNHAEEVRRVGARIKAEFGELIRSFPVERRVISEMSRWLGLTRPICQRVVQAVRHRGDLLEAVALLPGVQGLAHFAQAAAAAGFDARGADAAVVQYANLVDSFGGSQSRLIEAITAHRDAGAPGSHTGESALPAPGSIAAARRQIFEGARAITGREYGTQFAVFVYRPQPQSPHRVDCVTAMGIIDVRRSQSSMPICPITTFNQGDPARQTDDAVIGSFESTSSAMPVGTIDGFCSRPLPGIIARRHGTRASVIVDPAAPPGAPFDLVLGSRIVGSEHPAIHEPRMQTCSLVSDGPARRLVLAVHLHRSLAMASVASAGVYVRERVGAPIVGPGGAVDVATPDDRWFDRLPDDPRLEYLGLGLDRAPTPSYPRMRELMQTLFDTQAWAPPEFVGFRFEVEHPVWNAQYVMNFDFPADAPA